jgi:hypothetical protein
MTQLSAQMQIEFATARALLALTEFQSAVFETRVIFRQAVISSSHCILESKMLLGSLARNMAPIEREPFPILGASGGT